MNWRDKNIFVTGATGFIGGRICERLVQAGVRQVRTLVHNIQRAPRIARLPVELCPGDLLDKESLQRALSDSQIVIHCGLGVALGIVRGTTNLLEVAADAHVERFVHMSTTAVYGLTPPPGSETESAPIRRTGDPYCDNKGKAERVIARFVQRGLPAVVLRPSIVYGPYSAWSTRLIEGLRQHKVALIDEGHGACNTTYVDNLVDAVFLSLENDHSVGETFFINDGERITWGDFIRVHANMLETAPVLPNISRTKIVAYYDKQPGLLRSSIKQTLRMLLSRDFRMMLLEIPACREVLAPLWRSLEAMPPEKRQRLRSLLHGGTRNGNGARNLAAAAGNGYIPDQVDLATQTGTVFFAIDKARRLLGYEPRVQFAQGIKLVEQWLRFANYL
jgi:nucleoside-diphosphate-sugar epimerase